MYSAASKKAGAGGVKQSVAKEFVSADQGGKLPEHVADKKTRRAVLYEKNKNAKPNDN